MTLPLVIFLAVALPLTLIAALLLFVRSVTWFEARPQLRRWMIASLGLLYIALAIAGGLTEGWRWFAMLQLGAGFAMIAAAAFERPRTESV
ncbi:MAG: hypothetical protein ACYC7A_03415 [Thermoanaerobaculia bacterium]